MSIFLCSKWRRPRQRCSLTNIIGMVETTVAPQATQKAEEKTTKQTPNVSESWRAHTTKCASPFYDSFACFASAWTFRSNYWPQVQQIFLSYHIESRETFTRRAFIGRKRKRKKAQRENAKMMTNIQIFRFAMRPIKKKEARMEKKWTTEVCDAISTANCKLNMCVCIECIADQCFECVSSLVFASMQSHCFSLHSFVDSRRTNAFRLTRN